MANRLDPDSFDTRFDRDLEREGYQPRPIIALSWHGTLREQFAKDHPVSRCTTCSKPTAGVRCRECQEQDARECACGCYTVAGEIECTACGQGRAA